MRLLAFISLAWVVAVPGMACAKHPEVIVETNRGNITLRLNQQKAPETVKNFLQYVDDGFYIDVIFHRVIKKFMIQTGGFTTGMIKKKPRAPVKNEAKNGLKNKRGTVAMARTSDPDSGTSQFFISLVDNSFLDHKDSSARGMGYCVFAEVIEGMDVVDAIGNTPTLCASKVPGPCDRQKTKGMSDVPTEPVIIKSVKRK